MRLCEAVLSAGKEPSHRPLLITQDSIWTRRAFNGEVVRVCDEMRRLGVQAGSKVLLSLSNSPYFLIALLAVNRARGIVIPISPQLRPAEREQVLEIAQPDFQIGQEGTFELARGVWLSQNPTEKRTPDPLPDLAAILFTSGTTGRPKGVMMTDAALLANACSVRSYLELEASDRTLIFLPLFYSYSLSQFLTTMLAGGSLVLLENILYPVLVLRMIEEHRVTGLGGVPTSLSLLVNAQQQLRVDTPSLRYLLNAGGSLNPVLAEKLLRVFPTAQLFNNYGCTEIGPRATYLNLSRHPERTGSIGKPMPTVQLRLVAEGFPVTDPFTPGEIVLSGPSLMRGYYRDPETTARRIGPWGFHTGDIAHQDGDGYLYIQGRSDDLFKCAGEKVSTVEIETVLLSHPSVFEVAVVPVLDDRLGQVPIAYVVPQEKQSITESDLKLHCAARLSRHKVPQSIRFVLELEKTANGKIKKDSLREVLS